MMKRVGHEPQPAVIERRYNDFCFIYECILRSFHPSVLGDFQFPKKVLLGNFKAEVISERTDAFHKFLNLIANTNNLVTFLVTVNNYSPLCKQHKKVLTKKKSCVEKPSKISQL